MNSNASHRISWIFFLHDIDDIFLLMTAESFGFWDSYRFSRFIVFILFIQSPKPAHRKKQNTHNAYQAIGILLSYQFDVYT